MDNVHYKLVKNKTFEYYEVVPKPSNEELTDYYSNKYYQQDKDNFTYSHSYSQDELNYIENKLEQKRYILKNIFNDDSPKKIIDIGCGEGFILNHFEKLNWDVLGMDHSDFSISKFHPHLLDRFKKGDVFDHIKQLVDNKEQFDVIFLDNILEHVVDPNELISSCYQMLKKGGVLVVDVPNDFSNLQTELYDKKHVSKEYWVVVPDHLIYFTPKSLTNLCESFGFEKRKLVTDFPIEWYLINENSNYVNNKEFGSQAHKSRLFVENFIHNDNDLEQSIAFFEALAMINQGRVITGFFQK